MKARTTAALGSIAAVLALTLAGCASGDGNAGGARSAAPTKVNFVLNFTAGPQHAEFLAAEKDGFYKKAGLDVDTTTPSSTTDSISLVAGGRADVGLGYAGDVISAEAQGVPVETVAVIHRRIALGLISKPGSGITKPSDLIGKTVGLAMIPANVAMFDAMLAANGIKKSQVNVVPVGFNGVQMVASGKVDAADAVDWYEVGLYKQTTGVAPDYMEFTKFGAPDGYYLSVITSKKYAAQHADTLKAFVKAVLDAEKWTIENPAKANQVILDNVKGVTAEFATHSRDVLDTVIVDSAAKKHGIGWSDKKVWQSMVDFYVKSKQIDTAVDAGDLYTNEYLPSSPVRPTVPAGN